MPEIRRGQRSAQASCRSSPSRVPACAAPIFHSRSRHWAKVVRPSAIRMICGRPDPFPRTPRRCRAGRSTNRDTRRRRRYRSASPHNRRRHRTCVGCPDHRRLSSRAHAPPEQPISLSPPGSEPGVTPSAAPLPNDIPDDAVLPRGRAIRAPYARRYARRSISRRSARRSTAIARACRRSDPARTPQMVAAVGPATLDAGGHARLSDCVCARSLGRARACSRRRCAGSARKSSRSSRSRPIRAAAWSASGGSGISEHAFGNAIDIAAFTLADGRRITVQEGWHGTPGRAGLSARRASRRVRQFHDRARAWLQRRALQSHPCRSDAPLKRRPSVPAGSDVR